MRLTAALLAVVALVGHAPVDAPGQSSPAQQASYTYQGTVQDVSAEAGELTIITGVGFALRLIEIHVTPATTIVSSDTTLTLDRLNPGALVRAECRREDGTLVADRIERLTRPAGGPDGAP